MGFPEAQWGPQNQGSRKSFPALLVQESGPGGPAAVCTSRHHHGPIGGARFTASSLAVWLVWRPSLWRMV